MSPKENGKNSVDEALTLYGLCSLLSSMDPPDVLVQKAVERLASATGATQAAVDLVDESGQMVRRASSGSGPAQSPMEFPIMSGSRRTGTLLLALPGGGYDSSLHPLAAAASGIIGCLMEARTASKQLELASEREKQLQLRIDNVSREFEESRRSQPGLDASTSLPNEPLFRMLLQQAIARSRRGKQTLAVLRLDLDRFRDLKKTVGDPAAEEIVRQLAERLKRNCREGDVAARLDEDEFAWSISSVQKVEDIALLAAKALEWIGRPVRAGDQEQTVTASIGIGLFPVDGADADAILKASLSALHRSKESGRNTYHFYTEELNTRVHEQLEFQRRLKSAIDRGEFILHYQPVLNAATRSVEGVEALIRWQKPEGSLAFPGEFMPASEGAGLSARLDEWVMTRACDQVKKWSTAEGRPLRVTVNISSNLFVDQSFPWKVTSIVKESGIRADQLELDISQTVMMSDVEVSTGVLRRLKQAGVRLSMDDFGAGMLDLESLREFPVDAIKIDPAFVRDIHMNPYTSAVTAGILSLARSLKIHSVAKGVENEEQLKQLKNMQCDAFQGNLYSAAVAAGEIQTFLEQSRTMIVEPQAQSFEPGAEFESASSTQAQWLEPADSVKEKSAETAGAGMYLISCFHCGSIFNAVEAGWCECIVTENTVVCPQCSKCFCMAPVSFKMDFWNDAPQLMWERRMKEDSAEEPLAPNPPLQEVRRPAILFVDDERAILLAATRAIRGYGFTALYAQSGEQGLEIARKYIPDVVITDALMPKLDGREMCRMIKMDPRLAKVKVVIITSMETSARERAAAMKDYKSDEYLQKPLTKAHLEQILKQFAGLK